MQPEKRRQWLLAGAGALHCARDCGGDQAGGAAPPPVRSRGRGERRHAERAQLPVRARHVDDGSRDPDGPAHGTAAAAARRPADGVVALGTRCALPQRRVDRRSGRCARRTSFPEDRKHAVSEEAAAVTGPPQNLIAGVVKAIRPRQWVKNVLVFAAPVAALGSDVKVDYRDMLDQCLARVRGVLYGRLSGIPRQRRPRRRSRP